MEEEALAKFITHCKALRSPEMITDVSLILRDLDDMQRIEQLKGFVQRSPLFAEAKQRLRERLLLTTTSLDVVDDLNNTQGLFTPEEAKDITFQRGLLLENNDNRETILLTGRVLLLASSSEKAQEDSSQLIKYQQVAYQESYRQLTRALAFRDDLQEVYDKISRMLLEEKPSRYRSVMRHLHKLRWTTVAKLKEFYCNALSKIVTVAAVREAYRDNHTLKDKTIQIS